MSWTHYMYEQTKDMWERIYEHPFLRDLAAGTLSDERLAFYFEQNTHYINNVVKCRSIATAKAHNNEIRDFFLSRTAMVVDELHHQEDMLRRVGGQAGARIAPTCHAYTRHILNLVWTKDPVEYLGSFMPCPWTYDEIGIQLRSADLQGAPAEWWEFYMSVEHNELVANYRAFVDKYSEGLSDERRQQMLDNFIISTNYEYRFWDMAYNLEQWPLG
jgi:thiaminase/transcriptional activator TenA